VSAGPTNTGRVVRRCIVCDATRYVFAEGWVACPDHPAQLVRDALNRRRSIRFADKSSTNPVPGWVEDRRPLHG
jgi:hypothetical protein